MMDTFFSVLDVTDFEYAQNQGLFREER